MRAITKRRSITTVRTTTVARSPGGGLPQGILGRVHDRQGEIVPQQLSGGDWVHAEELQLPKGQAADVSGDSNVRKVRPGMAAKSFRAGDLLALDKDLGISAPIASDNAAFSAQPKDHVSTAGYGGGQWDDFGFSVSKAQMDRFCHVQELRPGGPAELSTCIFPGNYIISVDGRSTSR